MEYRFAIEANDIRKIEKLNALSDANTFWNDVRKLCARVTSDHSIGRWECLAERRFAEIIGE